MTISTQERTSIIELTVAMFHAAPGATYLAALESMLEANGHNMQALAIEVAGTSVYQSMYPVSQTADAFAAAFLTPLGLQANAVALDFIHAKFAAGVNEGQIVYEAIQALDATTAPEFAAAKALLANATAVADYYSVTVANPETNIDQLQHVIASVTASSSSVDAAIAAMSSTEPQTINLTTANDTYTIGAGNFSINGLGGDDTITTGSGNNVVTTVGGNDTVTTGAGNDTIVAGNGNNTVNAGNGANTVTTGTGNDTVTTGSGNDTIDSGAGGDTIRTGAGADHVLGGAGSDSIDLGVDTAVDTVVFAATAAANGSDVITSFTPGIDKLDLHAATSQSGATAVSGSLTVQAGHVYFLASGLSSVADSVAASAALLQGAAVWTNASTGVTALFVVNDDNSSAIYQYVEAGGAGITVGELTLMGTVDAKITASDLMYA